MNGSCGRCEVYWWGKFGAPTLQVVCLIKTIIWVSTSNYTLRCLLARVNLCKPLIMRRTLTHFTHETHNAWIRIIWHAFKHITKETKINKLEIPHIMQCQWTVVPHFLDAQLWRQTGHILASGGRNERQNELLSAISMYYKHRSSKTTHTIPYY